MDEYDALKAPDPKAWLATDEDERLALVQNYHRRIRVPRSPKQRPHAVIHVIVENQIADPSLPTHGHCERLVAEGLDRHEAVHALGSVIAEQVVDAARNTMKPQDEYWRKMALLTARGWQQNWAR